MTPPVESVSDKRTHIKEVFLPDSELIEFEVTAKGGEPLKATICWTDPAGTPVSGLVLDAPNKMLVNDLDLRIQRGQSVHQPWILNPPSPQSPATKGDNFRDNVEQVIINTPSANQKYTIRVSHKGRLVNNHKNTHGQTVSIILSGNKVEGTRDCDLKMTQTSPTERMLHFDTVVGARYRVVTSTDLQTFTQVGNELTALRDFVVQPVNYNNTDQKRFWRIERIYNN